MAGALEQPDVNEFTPEDFDAYLPEKWNSNMFTLQRRKVKGKLERMGLKLGEVLKAGDLSLVMHLSDEFPSLWNKKLVASQWLFFSRNEAARVELTDLVDKERTLADSLADPTPRFRHVFLGVALSKDYLEIGLHLHYDAWVDRQNFLSIVRNEETGGQLKQLLQTLPDHYEIGLTGEETGSPSELGDTNIADLALAFQEAKSGLFIGARLPGDQVPVLGTDVAETATEIFKLLIPIYKKIAWSSENDAISLDKLVAERTRALKASHDKLDRERAEREETLKERAEQGLKLREEIADRVRETQAWRQREQAARRAAAAAKAASEAQAEDARAEAEKLAAKLGLGSSDSKKESNASADLAHSTQVDTDHKQRPTESKLPETPPRKPHWKRDSARRPKPQSAAPEENNVHPKIPSDPIDICVGALVEVQKGFLRGRRGTVQSIDEKGGVKVNFGALSSRLEKQDMAVLARSAAKEKNRGYNRRNETDKPRRHFRAKLEAERGSPKKQPKGRKNGETTQSTRSGEGKPR